jgi:hypothetical protein
LIDNANVIGLIHFIIQYATLKCVHCIANFLLKLLRTEETNLIYSKNFTLEYSVFLLVFLRYYFYVSLYSRVIWLDIVSFEYGVPLR